MSVFQFTIPGSNDRPMLCDLRLPNSAKPAPIIVFVHGFKAFKDWGHFNVLANALCNAGLAVMKFSFSHNGTTPDHPEDFVDLEAFGHNTYSKELDDLGFVIDWLFSAHTHRAALDLDRLYLIGHSRGGGAVVLKAAEDTRVKKIVTWAGVADHESRVNPRELERWKSEGVMYVANARTKQNMPMYYTLREDFYTNKKRLDIQRAARHLSQPFLILHGTADESVPLREANLLKSWCKQAQLVTIADATHTFGGKHPFMDEHLPMHSTALLQATLSFLHE